MWWVLPVYTLIVSGSALEEKCSLLSQSSYSWTQNQMPSLYAAQWAPSSANLFLSVSMARYYLAAQPTPCSVPFVSERQSWHAAVHQQFYPGFMTSLGRTVQNPPEISKSSTTVSPLGAIPDAVQCGVRWTQRPLPTTAMLWLELSNYMPLSCPHLPAHSLMYFSLVSCLSLQVSSTLSRLSFLDFSTMIWLFNVINVWRSTDCNWVMYQSWLFANFGLSTTSCKFI